RGAARARARGLRACCRDVRRLDRVPPGAAGAIALALAHGRGADLGQRRDEHHLERRHVRGPRARRCAARSDEYVGRVRGDAGVGWRSAAMGGGAVVGTIAVNALAGRKRLAGDLGLGALLWGVPLALAAVWTNMGFVLVLVAVIGVGNTIVDVAGITLMQRTA